MQIIQNALLNKVGVSLDESYFYPLCLRLESTLHAISAESVKELFWQEIVGAHKQVYEAQKEAQNNYNSDGDWNDILYWQDNIIVNANQVDTQRNMQVKSLSALAVDVVLNCLAEPDYEARKVVNDQAALIFTLMHERISEISHAAKTCRPELWQTRGVVSHCVTCHLQNAQDLYHAWLQSDFSVEKLHDIDAELKSASYYAGGLDYERAESIREDDLAGMMAIEKVRHLVNQALSDDR